MTDCFALLGLPRRPGLDETLLQETYLRLAAAWHPDAAEGDVEKFRDLQEARKTLFDPATRLRHLLALEGGGDDSGRKYQLPGELFLAVASVLDFSRKALAKHQAVNSRIARAALAGELAEAGRKIQNARSVIDERRNDRFRQIAHLDMAWPEINLALLAEICAELAFLGRWDKELKESLFRLQSA